MASRDTLNITPDKSLIQKLGLTGYRTEQAIAELIDNSIDAGFQGTKENIVVLIDYRRKIISVKDDGIGMNKTTINNALTIARTYKAEKELGRFGLGMKSACSTLGKNFTIATASSDDPYEYLVKYDEDEWLTDASLSWNNYPIEMRAKQNNWHGTKITISKLKVPVYPNLVSNLRKSFGIRYAPFIKNSVISLLINNKECKPASFQLEENSKRTIEIKLPNGNKIYGWIGLLLRASVKGQYGIHLYKHGRLISSFEKFGIILHPSVARVIGEISLDHVPVNFHKTGFIEESLEYQEALEAFKNNPVVRDTVRKAEIPKTPYASLEGLLDYFSGSVKPTGTLDARVGAKRLRELFKEHEYKWKVGDKEAIITFEDSKGPELYRIHDEEDTIRLQINRANSVFKYIKNPLVIVGLILVEIELIGKDPKFIHFIQTRNERFTQFIDDWSKSRPLPRPRNEAPRYSENYSLSDELIEIYEIIIEKFPYKFQFTALSTLSRYLQHAHGRLIYNIIASKGSGQTLHDLLVRSQLESFVFAYEPTAEQLSAILDVTASKYVIVIRESGEIIGGSIAPAEKAWVDLVFEVTRHKMPLIHSELYYILEHLKHLSIVDDKKILNFAKRRKLDVDIKRFLGGEIS